jgi:predicted N-acetyltransferase YhbS
VELVEFGRLTPEIRADLEGDEDDPFDSRGITLVYRPKEQHVALRGESGRIVASTGMVVVDVTVAETRFPVVGIGGVIVSAAQRGRGLSRDVLTAALDRAAALGPAFALLFCHDDRAGLYERFGFSTVPPPVLVEQPDGIREVPQRTMVRPLRDGATWPAGPVRVLSLPF